MKNIKEQRKSNIKQTEGFGFADFYLSKHKNIIPYIQEPPSGLLHFVVVIPAYMEDKVLSTLTSLIRTKKPKGDVEVIVLINYSENDSNDNKIKSQLQFNELKHWCDVNSTDKFKFFSLLAADLPFKHAGAGMARKVVMDQALKRFNSIGSPEGLMLSLDADSVVDSSYFSAIEEKIYCKSEYGGCIMYFQHPIYGNEFSSEIYSAIIQYELHLRYYKNILRYTGFPFYQYTIGSCFGVRADLYAYQGGMNRRKAGEDFYFLHKLFPHKIFADINTTCVYPSPRPSMRVPFGTGATITQLLENKEEKYLTYNPDAFIELKQFLSLVPTFFKNSSIRINKDIEHLSESVKQYLSENNFIYKIEEIKRNTASEDSFTKRFFQWFDGFQVVKFLNLSHNIAHKKTIVEDAVIQFLGLVNNNKVELRGAENMLEFFREIDKNSLNL
jgi:hypothetical protein